MGQIRLAGQVYKVTLTPEKENFLVSLGEAAVQSAAVRADLYAHTQALLFIRKNLVETGIFDLSQNIAATEGLRSALGNLYQVDAATDFLTEAAGSLLGIYATGPTNAIRTGVVNAATSAGGTLADLGVDYLPLLAVHAVLDSIESENVRNVSLAQGILADLNAGRAIEADDIANASNAFMNMHAALVGVGSYLGADELLNGNGWTDAGDFVTNLAKGAFGPAVKFVKDGGVAVSSFFGTIVGAKKYLSTVETGGELLAIGNEVADILETFLTGTFGQFEQLTPESISRAETYFASLDTASPPEPTEQLDNEIVLSGTSATDLSDARFYVDNAYFLEAASGTQDFQVSLSEALPHDVRFKYSVYDLSGYGNATAGVDFVESMNQSVTIQAGQTTAQIPVLVIDDADIETPVERIHLAIYDPIGATLPNGKYNALFTGYIIDDEYLEQRITGKTVSEFIGDSSGTSNSISNVAPTSGGPNLAAQSFTSSLRSASYSEEVDVVFTVQNMGDAPSDGGRVKVVLARDSNTFANGKVLGDYNLTSLGAGDSTTYRKTVELPATSKGDHNFGILIEPAGSDTEATDDIRYVPLEIGAGLSGAPDLRVGADQIDDQILRVGDVVTYEYTVRAGSDGSPAYRHALYLSDDEFLSDDDIQVHSGFDDGLGYLGANYVTATFTLPSIGREGPAYLIAEADSMDDLQEDDETNNTRAREFSLTERGPDDNALTNLTAGELTLSHTILTPDDTFRYEARVSTTSIDDPVPTLDRYQPNLQQAYMVSLILSEDNVYDPDDLVLHTSHKTGLNVVDDGGVLMRFRDWVPSGSYYLGFAVDILNEIPEDNEVDNFSAWKRIDVVNEGPTVVQAFDDRVLVTPGAVKKIDLTANDISTVAEDLAVNYLGPERAISSVFSGLALGGGVRLDLLADGSIEIDASLAEVGFNTTFRIPYTVFGRTSDRGDLGYVEVVVGETLFGSALPNLLRGDAGDNTLDGLQGDDRVYGDDGADGLYGGGGSDLLIGGLGADTMFGGAGTDTADYAGSTAGVIVNLETGSGWGAPGSEARGDTLSGIERILGSDHDDRFTGNGADNVFAGGLGRDAMFGAAGVDTADYSGSAAGVIVNLERGSAWGAPGSEARGDTLSGIERILGSDHDDRFTGNGADNVFAGGLGRDAMFGAAGVDTADYSGSAAGVIVNLESGSAWGAPGSEARGDTLSGIERILGSDHDDRFTGNGADNVFAGGLGRDAMFGAAGVDTADYSGSTAGVIVNLESGSAWGAPGSEARGDTLSGIERILGSDHDDRFTGNGADNVFAGGLGRDAMFGAAGVDTADYSGSTAGVIVNLASGNAWGAPGSEARGDTLSGIERILGSDHDDRFTGNGADNVFAGGLGRDAMFGAAGVDTADYSGSAAGVIVNLESGSAWGAPGSEARGDTLSGIERILGSDHDDRLSGNALANLIEGGLGDDTMTGAGDGDTFVFTTTDFGHDTIRGWQEGHDMLDMTNAGLSFSDFTSSASGNDTLLELTADPAAASILFAGISTADIDGFDFV